MNKLEAIANASVIAVSIAALSLLIEHRITQTRDSSPTQAQSAKQLEGRSLRLAGADWAGAPLTLVLQLSSDCHFCTESMPFYRRVVSTVSTSSHKIPLLVASSDHHEVAEAYLNSEHIPPQHILQLESGGALTLATPVIFFVDSVGVVRKSFVGKLDASAENDVLAILRNGHI